MEGARALASPSGSSGEAVESEHNPVNPTGPFWELTALLGGEPRGVEG